MTPGEYLQTLIVDNRERKFIVHVPELLPPPPWPLVLAFHGSGSSAAGMVRFSGLSDKADAAGFVVAYPEGTGRDGQMLTFNAGNCCGRAALDQVDDVLFTHRLLDELLARLPLDADRIFATGMSNGAMLCYRLASEMADRIAAIGPVAGPMGTPDCRPTRPVSVCHFHGTRDGYAPYAGGRGPRSMSKTIFYSVPATIEAWVQANGCQREPVIDEFPGDDDHALSVERRRYAGGQANSEVVLYTIRGGGHTWPGRASAFTFLGPTTPNLSANDVLWDFFCHHPRIDLPGSLN